MSKVGLIDAFPASIRGDVEVALRALPETSHPARYSHEPLVRNGETLVLDGETLRIPSRIYNPEPAPLGLEALTPQCRVVLSCLLSRHHDGHVRLRHGTAAVRSGALFAIPFVVVLAGDYVVEVVEAVRAGLADLTDRSSQNFRVYGRFLDENPAALLLLRQRTISFWNEHHRQTIPRDEYPGFALVAALEKAAEYEGRHPHRGRKQTGRIHPG